MSKKKEVQLQIELNSEEDWEKFISRDGLLVIDVYSDWCGPCSAMAANLKKLKLEMGGDLLQLGIAKSDNIEALKRFRNKSEPTWLFVVKGKQVNMMFGTNAPKLMKLITSELEIEKLCRAGQYERSDLREITEMADEEAEIYEAKQALVKREIEKEEEKRRQELHERRHRECLHIIENLGNVAVVIIFPQFRERYSEALSEPLMDSSLVVGQTEKIFITPEILEELLYFATPDEDLPPEIVNQILAPDQVCLALLIKPSRTAAELTRTIDEVILELVYGKMMKPPGSPDSPAQKLVETVEESQEDLKPIPGIWSPPNEFVRAACLKLFFRKLTANYIIPEPQPTPDHLAVAFDVLKRSEIYQLMQQYPQGIMRYGFFTSEEPEVAQLVAKSFKKYEKTPNRTFKERIVLQLSKKNSECIFAFAQSNPLYISPNPAEGKRQCKLFFPDDYDEPPEDDEEDISEYMSINTDVMSYLQKDDEYSEEDSEEEAEEEEEEEEYEEEEEEDDDLLKGSLFGDLM